MRRALGRILVMAAVLVMVPAYTALAADLDQILEESKDASYGAEQVITCSTPDGVRNAVVELSQASGELHIGASVAPDVEVASGFGGWSLVRDGDVVSSANVDEGGETPDPLYAVDQGVPTDYLGRQASMYRMTADGVVRAELVVDSESGALLRVVTFNADGSVFCERRFVTFDPDPPTAPQAQAGPAAQASEAGVESDLPGALGDFQRLDVYRDEEGILFAYYSDGFFSFAVFQTPTLVVLQGGSKVTVGDGAYTRSFGPGQVTYAWETRGGAMAIVGDLPPDMHQEILEGLPDPQDPGLWRRLWRNLFGEAGSTRPL